MDPLYISIVHHFGCGFNTIFRFQGTNVERSSNSYFNTEIRIAEAATAWLKNLTGTMPRGRVQNEIAHIEAKIRERQTQMI